MEVILIIDNSIAGFQKCLEYNSQQEKWQLWSTLYYPEYSALYDTLLKNIYMLDLGVLKELVYCADFQKLNTNVINFITDNRENTSIDILNDSANKLNFHFDFKFYIHVGLGNIGGTALAINEPLVYLGVENYAGKEDLKYVLSHELCHLKREMSLFGVKNSKPEYSLGEMVVSEGLATVFSSIFCNDGVINPRYELCMSDKQYQACMTNDVLAEEILNHWDTPASGENRDLIFKYMTGGTNSLIPDCYGYYFGNVIIRELLKKHSFDYLIGLNDSKILSEYLAIARI